MPAVAPFIWGEITVSDGFKLTLVFSEDRSADTFRAFVYKKKTRALTADADINLTEGSGISKSGVNITVELTQAQIEALGISDRDDHAVIALRVEPSGEPEDTILKGPLYIRAGAEAIVGLAASSTVITIGTTSVTVTPVYGALTYASINSQTALGTLDDESDEVVLADISATSLKKMLFSVLMNYIKARIETLTNKTLGAGTTAPPIIFALSDETTDLTTGTAKGTFRMPYAMTITGVRASVTTAPVGATIIVDINDGGTTILSTKLTIDASEKTSQTAATPPVISDSALADDAEITFDIDQVGSSTAGAGLKVTLLGTYA